MDYKKKLIKKAKFWFVFMLSLVALVILYAILDFLLAGVLYLVVSLFGKASALVVFKWTVVVLLALQIMSTIPAISGVVESRIEEEESEEENSGT